MNSSRNWKESRIAQPRPGGRKAWGFIELLHKNAAGLALPHRGWAEVVRNIDEMQKGLDAYLIQYNTKRPHQVA